MEYHDEDDEIAILDTRSSEKQRRIRRLRADTP